MMTGTCEAVWEIVTSVHSSSTLLASARHAVVIVSKCMFHVSYLLHGGEDSPSKSL